ncbi:hypothetical protein ACHHYP_05126 [Achlya hypogyna]|uniref:HAUS augmin-like complex subunit 3 N-terminal domain-containing protein n=1 Tax=Achlya hypogyna TaxID=1202772 RepID=A0A1V9YZ17_ACHHY|nr:hypothetical protein ACHHYP_05126 [Achlya hypogyna]
MAASSSAALAKKLAALGCPVETRAEALEALCGHPSRRLQAFLHWFVHALDDDMSMMAQFNGDDRQLLASQKLLDGDELSAKEQEVFGEGLQDKWDDDDDDLDEAGLAEAVAHLERQVLRETRKHATLRQAVEAKRHETSRLSDSGLDIVPDALGACASVSTAVDAVLRGLDPAENAYNLASLSPQAITHVTLQEGKLLDTVQAHLAPLRKQIPTPALETIPESPNHSNAVRWLHESLSDEMDLVHGSKKRQYKACSTEFRRLQMALPRGSLLQLHVSLDATAQQAAYTHVQCQREHVLEQGRLMDPALLTTSTADLNAETSRLQTHTQHVMREILPPRLDELARLDMTSVVLGDYKDKISRQTRQFAHQEAILELLEQQSARLLLLSHVLGYEKTQVTALASQLQALRGALKDRTNAMARRLAPRRNFGEGPATADAALLLEHIQAKLGPAPGTLEQQCRQHVAQMDQLHAIRSNIRDEYHGALERQLATVTALRQALASMDLETYDAIEALEARKLAIADGIKAATAQFQAYENIVLHANDNGGVSRDAFVAKCLGPQR